VTSHINPPELKLGQGILHVDLQTLYSDLVDMHNLSPKIEGVIEFQKGLSVWTFETNISPHLEFL
jgi:hypothetical protein